MEDKSGFFVTVGIITGLMAGFELITLDDDDWIFIIDFFLVRIMFSNKAID